MTRLYYFIHATDQPNPTTVIYSVKIGQSAKELKNLATIVKAIATHPTDYYFTARSVKADEFIYKLKTITGMDRTSLITSTECVEMIKRYNTSAIPST